MNRRDILFAWFAATVAVYARPVKAFSARGAGVSGHTFRKRRSPSTNLPSVISKPFTLGSNLTISGTTVTDASNTNSFSTTYTSTPLTINGVAYTIASRTNANVVVLASAPGNATGQTGTVATPGTVINRAAGVEQPNNWSSAEHTRARCLPPLTCNSPTLPPARSRHRATCSKLGRNSRHSRQAVERGPARLASACVMTGLWAKSVDPFHKCRCLEHAGQFLGPLASMYGCQARAILQS